RTQRHHLGEQTWRACLNMSVQFGTGWLNLLLRDKLPTGNEQGSAGMATVGSGAYTYEPVENWAKLPPGWSFKEIGGVGVDRHDNVFVFNRGEHPMIVFDRDGNFLRSFGEGMFPRAHGVFMAPDDTIWLTDDGDHTVRDAVEQPAPSVRPVHATRQVPGLLHRRTRRRATGEPQCAEPWPAGHHCRQHGEAHFPTRRAWPGPWSNRVLGAAWACGGQPRRPLC